ncbi:unnamed protein product [Vitrella brassicaformis CCMP3155]|uniref:Subtilisin n=1 Tax=Vitrella brassicaformis (strain CCMP3155) TaxID=1169540 RepID=A0A0G4E8J9_VITBC|nr:unnamed protein product [Vitrella brassicaformis CCMP3155]|eukprot:CEL91672.1 unnamed protein product [Vitrella brassicaformis CCMP3155]
MQRTKLSPPSLLSLLFALLLVVPGGHGQGRDPAAESKLAHFFARDGVNEGIRSARAYCDRRGIQATTP